MSTLNRVVRKLTFDDWMGYPIPRRRKPDGVWSNVGSRVRYGGVVVGFIWSEWFELEGDKREVVCRKLADDDSVTRATIDTAAAAFALASEWAERNEIESIWSEE